MCAQPLIHVQYFVAPWTVAHQAPLSTGFSRQEYRVGCHSLQQGISLTQGPNPHLLHWQADPVITEPPGMPHTAVYMSIILKMIILKAFLQLNYLCCTVKLLLLQNILYIKGKTLWLSLRCVEAALKYNVLTYITNIFLLFKKVYSFRPQAPHNYIRNFPFCLTKW